MRLALAFCEYKRRPTHSRNSIALSSRLYLALCLVLFLGIHNNLIQCSSPPFLLDPWRTKKKKRIKEHTFIDTINFSFKVEFEKIWMTRRLLALTRSRTRLSIWYCLLAFLQLFIFSFCQVNCMFSTKWDLWMNTNFTFFFSFFGFWFHICYKFRSDVWNNYEFCSWMDFLFRWTKSELLS